MANKDANKILNDLLVKSESSEWRKDVEFRKEHKDWLKKSAKIAIKINRTLRSQNIKQKDLAKRLDVSEQMVSKILKGRENLTLETICKLESALGVELISILRQDEIVVDIPRSGFVMSKAYSVSKVYGLNTGIVYKEVASANYSNEERAYAKAI